MMERSTREWLMLLGAVLVTALFAHAAKAAPPCYPLETGSTNFGIELEPEDTLKWLAAPDATFSVVWFCDEKYKWTGQAFVGLRRNLLQNFIAEASRLSGASRTDKDAAWSQYITNDCVTNPKPEHADVCAELPRKYNLSRPAAIVWQVRDNPSATSRPVFAAGGGVRNTAAISGQRVSDVNTDCGCVAQAIEESGGTYCSVAGRSNVATPADDVLPADRVALCVRTN